MLHVLLVNNKDDDVEHVNVSFVSKIMSLSFLAMAIFFIKFWLLR